MNQATPEVAVIRMYAAREEIYPREIKGRYASLRWACVWITQLMFYGLPWAQWNGRQAVLFDLGARKFYLLGIVLWPQDFIFLAVLLIICAFSLFLFTAVAGRLWCGFACPQTVYTEIFMWIERKIEGTRSARMRLDRQPWSIAKLARKTAKHAAWGAVALWTGFTFVGYFTPIGQLASEVMALALGPWELFWVLFYAFATYGNAGWMREQVCKYMCPYARFQSAMLDADTLIVTYDKKRGEPRGVPAKAAANVSASISAATGLGDCIDCTMCVQVCPTGIDIRNGLQYDCIGCAACIDACNLVMDKVDRPRGLIRYATDNGIRDGLSVREIRKRTLRPRILVYIVLLVAICGAFFGTLLTRTPLKVDVIRDRGAMGREVDDGAIENVYRLQIMNTDERPHRYHISVSGIDSIALATPDEVAIESTLSRGVPVQVRVAHGKARPGSNPIAFDVKAIDEPALQVHEKAVFLAPR
jgi:cytochrome c oxidase accessory protein FixG